MEQGGVAVGDVGAELVDAGGERDESFVGFLGVSPISAWLDRSLEAPVSWSHWLAFGLVACLIEVARDGVRRRRPLAEVPEFVAGVAAANWLSVEQVWRLARRSSELSGVNTMLHRGPDPSDLMLAPVVVFLVAGRP
ncbi:hypothetical protein BKA01_008076 [Pseudonocardia eucalypti]|uniref:hypothetical protein n=1 Tax=Pseudonocardia eucalypti TaxID=648755 RepID=UPI0016149DA9|nr:hypothetical protein [Pseudonocardia eucalypti]